MKLARTTITLAAALAIAGCSNRPGWLGGEDAIPLEDVPAQVKTAAMNEVPGLEIRSVERDSENGVDTYEVNGVANGKKYEIEVTEAGRVLEVEED